MASETTGNVEAEAVEIANRGSASLRVRAGLASLALAGLLVGVGILARGPAGAVRNPDADPTGFVALVTATAFTVWMVTTVASVLLRLFGFLALYALLADTRVERTALAGLVLGTTGLVLFVHVLGVAHFAWPAVGRFYRAGGADAIRLAGFPGYSMAVFGGSVVLLLVALVLFGIAMWRSGRLPRGAVALFVLHVVPLNLGGVLGYRFESLGGFVLALAATWMLLAVRGAGDGASSGG